MKRDLIGVNTESERTAINMTATARLLYANERQIRRVLKSVVLSGVSASNRLVEVTDSHVAIDEVDFYARLSRAIIGVSSVVEISHSTFSGVAANTGQNFATFILSNTTIDDSLFYDISGYANTAIYGDDGGNLTIRNSVFSHLINTYGGGIRYEECDVHIEDSIFEYCRSADPYSTSSGGGLIVLRGNVYIARSQFKHNFASHGSSIFLTSAYNIHIEGCDIDDNEAVRFGALHTQVSTSITLYNNRFRNNKGGMGAVGVIINTPCNLTGNTISGNEAREAFALYIGTIAPDDPSTWTTRLPAHIADNVFFANRIANAVPTYQLATSLYIVGSINVDLAGNHFSGDDTEIAIRPLLVSFASVKAMGSPTNGTMPQIHGGLMIAGGNLSINQDWTVFDSLGFNNFEGVYQLGNHFHMNGHTVTVPGDDSTYSLLMSAHIYDGLLHLEGGNAFFCCSKPDLFNRTLRFHNVTLIGTDSEFLFATSTPVWADDSSRIIMEYSSIFWALNDAPTELHVPELLFIDAVMDVLDFTLYGNLTADYESLFYGYPSLWNGTSHPFVVHGHVDAGPTRISLYDKFAIAPFAPTVTMQDGPIEVIRIYDSSPNIIAGLPMPRNGTYSTTNYVARAQSLGNNGMVMTATPVRIMPLHFIQPDLGTIALIFRTDLPFVVTANCSGFLAPSTSLDASTTKCVLKDLRTIIVSSARLPGPGEMVEIDESHPFAQTFPVPMNPVSNAILPVPVLRPVATRFSCGVIPLDGSLSTGFGSYAKTFVWGLESSTANPASLSAITSYLASLPADSPIVNLPVSLFVPGETYQFSLSVANIAKNSVAVARVSFTAISAYFLPPLLLNGPAERGVYLGTDVSISAVIDSVNCDWDSSKIRFLWSHQIGSGPVSPLSPELTNGSPTLFVPASFFEANGETNVTFYLHAFPDASLGFDQTANTSLSALVYPIHRPLAVKTGLVKNEFYNEDVVLSVEVDSLGGAENFTVLWTLVSCPVKSNYDYFRSLHPNQPDVAADVRNGFDCINSAGVGYVFPFATPTDATTIVPQGSIESGAYVVQATVTTSLGDSEIVTVPFRYVASNPEIAPVKVVIESPPPGSIVATHKFSLSARVDDVYEGLEADALYDFYWTTTFGDWSIPENRNGHSVLVIPHSAITPLQRMSIAVHVTSKTQDRPAGSHETSVAVSEAPTGGRLLVSPSSGDMALTHFTLSSLDWTTKFWPLRYQYFIIDPNTEEEILIPSDEIVMVSQSESGKRSAFNTQNNAPSKEIALTEITDLARVANLTLSVNPPLHASSGLIALKVRVFDALGGEAEALTQITLNYPSNQPSKRVATENSLLQGIEVAVNASSWQQASTLISDFLGLAESGIIEMNPETADRLVDIFTSLPTSLPLTELNVVTLLTQIHHYMGLVAPSTDIQAQKVQIYLASLLNSPMSRFGSYSGYSAQSSEYFIRTISSILRSPDTRPLLASGSIDFNTLVLVHGVQHLDSLVPGEPSVETNTNGLNLASGLVPIQSGEAKATTAESDVSVTFSPSDYTGDSTDGYIGYHFLYYRGTFPHNISNFGFDTVAEIQVLKPQEFSRRRAISTAQFGSTSAVQLEEAERTASSVLSHGQKRTYQAARASLAGSKKIAFNVTEPLLQEKKSDCAVFDEATRSWKQACTTTKSGTTISCNCGNEVQGPLTILFSDEVPATPNAAGSKKGMSASAIAAAVIVPLVIIAVGIAAFIFYKNHYSNAPSRDVFRTATPANNAGSNQVEMQTAPASAPAPEPAPPQGGGWTKSAKPSAL
jgi:hypothetical protein